MVPSGAVHAPMLPPLLWTQPCPRFGLSRYHNQPIPIPVSINCGIDCMSHFFLKANNPLPVVPEEVVMDPVVQVAPH